MNMTPTDNPQQAREEESERLTKHAKKWAKEYRLWAGIDLTDRGEGVDDEA